MRFFLSFMVVCLTTLPTLIAEANERRQVYFHSFDVDQTPIRGELFKPNREGPYSAIIMMHGCSGLYKKSGEIKTNSAAWISRFVKWGHVVLAVDGFTPRGFRSMCGKQTRPLHALDDRPFDA